MSKRRTPGPFPAHILKRVPRPTTRIDDAHVPRVDERDGGFVKAGQGEYGDFVKQEYGRFMSKYPLSDALLHMSKMLGQEDMVDGPVRADRAPDTDDPVANARHLKELAFFLKADDVGICELPPYAVFTHGRVDDQPIELKHKYAFAILVDQDYETSRGFNGSDWISNAMSFKAYSTSGFIACAMADYIRRLGYPARAHHAKNYQVLVPPILLWAGLGEMSRMGDVVLNPFLGPRFKAAIITTDMPLAIDQPIDFGLQDFCDKCKKCARECPSGAIPEGGKVFANGYEKWQVDVQQCTSFRCSNQFGSGCGTCIKVCPWNKPYTRFHRGISWMVRNLPFTRNFAARGDDLLGYGKVEPDRKWWLDIEDVDGRWVTGRTKP